MENFVAFMRALKPEFMLDYPSITERMVPVLLCLIVIEVFLYKRKTQKAFPTKELFSSLAIGAMYGVAKLVALTVYAGVFVFLYDHRLFTIPMNSVWSWIGVFFAVEFAYYWFHRFSHRNKWYWASHATHHTPENIFFAVAFQLSLTSVIAPTLPFLAGFVLLGFHPGALLFMYNANLIFQFFLHTEVVRKMPAWFEYIFNTPSHHRVHHASNPEYIDKNYGGMLIIFDRMFGTFYEERDDIQIKYGLINGHGSLNPLMIGFYPTYSLLRDIFTAKKWSTKFLYFVSPPEADLKARDLEQVDVKARAVDSKKESA